jgi:hypothetical protein
MKKKIILLVALLVIVNTPSYADDVSNCLYGYDSNTNVTTKEVTHTCLPYREPLPTVITNYESLEPDVIINGNIVSKNPIINITPLIVETSTVTVDTATVTVDTATATSASTTFESLYAQVMALLTQILALIAKLKG